MAGGVSSAGAAAMSSTAMRAATERLNSLELEEEVNVNEDLRCADVNTHLLVGAATAESASTARTNAGAATVRIIVRNEIQRERRNEKSRVKH